MKAKKFQIFVSSTYNDLKEERQAAVEAILSAGHIPAGMELFAAGDESQMTVIKRWIDESDIFLLILAGKYGSIDPKSGKSYTQLEYEYASKLKKPIFAVVISDNALKERVRKLGPSISEQKNIKKLKQFKLNILKTLVKFWDDKKDIKLAIHETVSEFAFRKNLIGWIRGDNAINAGALAEEIARLTKENSELRSKLEISNNDSIALYSGLSYLQLRELLKEEKVNISNGPSNLFDLLFTSGQALSVKLTVQLKEYMVAFDKLKLYKLVKSEILNSTQYICSFTQEGHNFYLKALSLEKKNQ